MFSGSSHVSVFYLQDQTTVKIYENLILLVHEKSEDYNLSKSHLSCSGTPSLSFIKYNSSCSSQSAADLSAFLTEQFPETKTFWNFQSLAFLGIFLCFSYLRLGAVFCNVDPKCQGPCNFLRRKKECKTVIYLCIPLLRKKKKKKKEIIL